MFQSQKVVTTRFRATERYLPPDTNKRDGPVFDLPTQRDGRLINTRVVYLSADSHLSK